MRYTTAPTIANSHQAACNVHTREQKTSQTPFSQRFSPCCVHASRGNTWEPSVARQPTIFPRLGWGLSSILNQHKSSSKGIKWHLMLNWSSKSHGLSRLKNSPLLHSFLTVILHFARFFSDDSRCLGDWGPRHPKFLLSALWQPQKPRKPTTALVVPTPWQPKRFTPGGTAGRVSFFCFF